MSHTLYEQFSTVLKSLPDGDVIGAVEAAESFVNGACHNCDADTVLSLVATGRPADRLVLLFDGRTVAEAAAVMTQLRGEIADELALIFPRRRGQVDYAAKAATWDRNSNSIGLRYPMAEWRRAVL